MEDETKSAKEDNFTGKILNRNRSSLDDLLKNRKIGFRALSRNNLCNSTKNLSVSSNFYKTRSMFNRTVINTVT
jgi:hypothetical protein